MSVSRQKPNYTIPALLALAAALIALVTYFGVVAPAVHQGAYKSFVSGLSRSTAYAYQNDSLVVTDGEGRSFPVTGDQVYFAYQTLTTVGAGTGRSKLPEGEADLSLDFGDGSRLRLWGVKVRHQSGSMADGIFVCYENQEGKRYLYDNATVSLLYFQKAYRAEAFS